MRSSPPVRIKRSGSGKAAVSRCAVIVSSVRLSGERVPAATSRAICCVARRVAEGYDEGDALAGSGSLDALTQSLLRLLGQTAEVANGLETHAFFDEAGGLGVNSRDEEVHQGIDLFLGA